MIQDTRQNKLGPGDSFIAAMHWRFDEAQDIRVTARFLVQIVALDWDDLRYLCRITELAELSASHPLASLDPALLARVRSLPGLHTYLPFEAAEGRTLFLKIGTLTGRHDYFFDETSGKWPRQ